jgi:hypothetical protein
VKREGRLMSCIVLPDSASKRQRIVAIRVVLATSVEGAKVATLNLSKRGRRTAKTAIPWTVVQIRPPLLSKSRNMPAPRWLSDDPNRQVVLSYLLLAM